jgi:DNA-binding transcriptional LysR family regulator
MFVAVSSTVSMNLAGLDLNLLVALDALLEEASVSRAAKRLGIGQPATSHALGRLRDLFGDRLLVRSGRGMVLTPRAESLRVPLRRVLNGASSLLDQEASFDPQTSRRTFSMLCPDLLGPVVPGLLDALRGDAPHVRLEVGPRGNAMTAIESGQADIALTPAPTEGSGLVIRRLGTLRFGVVARKDHPAIRSGRITLRRWLSHPHIVVRSGSSSRSIVGTALAEAGIEREVGLVVPSFLSALLAASGSDALYAAPLELVADLTTRLGLTSCALPVQVPRVPVAALWHERFQDDPAHAFFRAKAVSAVDAVLRGH